MKYVLAKQNETSKFSSVMFFALVHTAIISTTSQGRAFGKMDFCDRTQRRFHGDHKAIAILPVTLATP